MSRCSERRTAGGPQARSHRDGATATRREDVPAGPSKALGPALLRNERWNAPRWVKQLKLIEKWRDKAPAHTSVFLRQREIPLVLRRLRHRPVTRQGPTLSFGGGAAATCSGGLPWKPIETRQTLPESPLCSRNSIARSASLLPRSRSSARPASTTPRANDSWRSVARVIPYPHLFQRGGKCLPNRHSKKVISSKQ